MNCVTQAENKVSLVTIRWQKFHWIQYLVPIA